MSIRSPLALLTPAVRVSGCGCAWQVELPVPPVQAQWGAARPAGVPRRSLVRRREMRRRPARTSAGAAAGAAPRACSDGAVSQDLAGRNVR